MNKILVLVALIFFCDSCSCHNSKKKNEEIKSDEILMDFNITLQRIDPQDLFLTYLDSVKQFKPGMPLQYFFYNPLLDYENPWLADHYSQSIRKMVFDSTQSIDVLNAILNSTDPRLKLIADSNLINNKALLKAIPYANLSNYDMAEKRFTELERKVLK